ncbi:MAG: cysteine--tRNA ligase [Patescibacteria group bacterium]|nr:cysteine--tRNA ligase [Patescibacteria group bacterium]MDD5490564.1 cysteine--tRNA ligase [Patescibacteria group bacterium]
MLNLYNTLTRSKEKFKPLNDNKVGIYTCGPTVYNYAHVGNLRSYVFADVLVRVLKYNGYKVKQVMNITDVGHLTSDADEGEDKLEKGAEREGKSPQEIARFYSEAFLKDLKNLNINFPDIFCRATDHLEEQIKLIKKLESKGYTYRTKDGIYFDTSKIKDYGRLAGLDVEGLRAGERVEFCDKKNTTDFALWKFSPAGKKRQQEWESPWGVGFPGWHIECSAMSMEYLGEAIDIHTGGRDHIPVHHTNERAQNMAATGKEVVKFWIHNEFVILKGGEKMAKSAENFLTLGALQKKGFNALAYRYLLLNTHYHNPVEFSWESLAGAKNALDNLYKKIAELGRFWFGKVDENYERQFCEAINDDLNIPQALAVAWELLKDEKISRRAKKKTLLKFDEVLGLNLDDVRKEKIKIPSRVKELIEKRDKARQSKDWAESDRWREEIQKLGFEVEDTEQGTKVKRLE